MKPVLAAAVAAAFAVATFAVPATAATPTQRIAKLEKLVKKQQKEITTLKKQVQEAQEVGAVAVVFSVCSTAITADAFMATWGTINQVEGRSVIGSQTPVAEPACSRLAVPRTQASPPNVAAFAQLLRLVNQPFATYNAFSTVFG